MSEYYATPIDEHAHESDLNELYSEWTGHDLRWKNKILCNTWFSGVIHEGKVVGCATLQIIDDVIWDKSWGLVENVYIAKDHRRKGLGQKLMRCVESVAMGWGCDFIKLTSSKGDGIALYRSLKYTEGYSFRYLTSVNQNNKPLTVAVAGGFDPIHPGHLRHFQMARRLGDRLVVIVGTDETLIKKKGMVFMPLEQRIEVLRAIRGVDQVVIQVDTDGTCAETLDLIRPDVFAKGGDRTKENMPQAEIDICKKIDCEIVYNVGQQINSSTDLVHNAAKLVVDLVTTGKVKLPGGK